VPPTDQAADGPGEGRFQGIADAALRGPWVAAEHPAMLSEPELARLLALAWRSEQAG